MLHANPIYFEVANSAGFHEALALVGLSNQTSRWTHFGSLVLIGEISLNSSQSSVNSQHMPRKDSTPSSAPRPLRMATACHSHYPWHLDAARGDTSKIQNICLKLEGLNTPTVYPVTTSCLRFTTNHRRHKLFVFTSNSPFSVAPFTTPVLLGCSRGFVEGTATGRNRFQAVWAASFGTTGCLE